MKITNIRTTPVNIPLEVPFHYSLGFYPGTSKTIVEVETDEGIVGLGEAPSPDCAEFIERHLTPKLMGLNPFDIAGCASLTGQSNSI